MEIGSKGVKLNKWYLILLISIIVGFIVYMLVSSDKSFIYKGDFRYATILPIGLLEGVLF